MQGIPKHSAELIVQIHELAEGSIDGEIDLSDAMWEIMENIEQVMKEIL